MLSLNYPACVGRSMDEIVRCVAALQLSYEKSIATPANWPDNHEDVELPNGTRTDAFKGSVFLLPTVSKEEAEANYPGYYTCPVPSKKDYLRLVKNRDIGHTVRASANETAPPETAPVASSEKRVSLVKRFRGIFGKAQ
jgi:peroxiredoxin 6